MTVNNEPEESVYFFALRQQHESLIFDIKHYLKALGSGDNVKVQEYRSKFGCIEEEYASEWIEALLPYFKTKKSESVPVEGLKLSTQNQIYLEKRTCVDELKYLEESTENWIGEPKVLVAFLACLKRIKDFSCIETRLNLLFPMICQVSDDYRTKFKIKGVKLLQEFMRIVPANIFLKFNLHLVIYESLRVNVTFDSDELMQQSIDSWIELIGLVEEFGGKDFLKRSDELLLILCRDVSTTACHKIDRKIILLKSIGRVVNDLMTYCSIRYMRKIVVTLIEAVKEDFTNEAVVCAGRDSMELVIQNCWIRLKESPELQELILNTFDGDERINNLLKLIKT